MLNAAAPSSGVIGKFFEIVRREIRQRVAFKPAPEVFHWVQLRRVWREKTGVELGRLADKRLNLFRPVRQEPIPDNNSGSFNLAFQLTQKNPHIRSVEVGVRKETEIKFHPLFVRRYDQSRNGRNFLVGTRSLRQDRRIPSRRPASADQRSHQQTAFVYEDDGRFKSRGFFLMLGHSSFIQVLICSSLRSLACRLGFCGVQPSERKSLATWWAW